MHLTNPNRRVKIFSVGTRAAFGFLCYGRKGTETVRDKCRICFLILLSVVLVGWIGGWTRTLKAGNEAYTDGDYHAAQIAFREAALQKPDSPLAHYNLGTAFYRTGRFNEAIEAFRESLSRHNGEPEARLRLAHIYYNLGNAQFQMGDLRRAIDAYRHSLRLGSQTMPTHNIISHWHFNSHNSKRI